MNNIMDLKQEEPDRVLCVGMCVIDIIHVCAEYPLEDSDKRSKHGRWQRGGNASNNCTVLARLGRPVHFLGPLSSATIAAFLLDDMQQRGIEFADCPRYDGEAPLSSVLLNEQTGSRTIIHSNPGVPPLRAVDFERVDLSAYAWVHFEGRQPGETVRMMERIVQHNRDAVERNGQTTSRRRIRISLDMEKTDVNYVSLMPLVDVAFVGKDLARHWGCATMQEAAERLWRQCDGGLTVICAWGEAGAALIDPEGRPFESGACAALGGVVDSLGAGDTFAAATIHAMCERPQLYEAAIRFGCRMAGDKVGHVGYDCVRDAQRELLLAGQHSTDEFGELCQSLGRHFKGL